MKTRANIMTLVIAAVAALLPHTGNCSPINRELTLIGIEVIGKNNSEAIFESNDGDSVTCNVGCVIGAMKVTQISRAGIVVKNFNDEMFIPIGNSLAHGGVKADMAAVPVFEMVTTLDAGEGDNAIDFNAFAPLS